MEFANNKPDSPELKEREWSNYKFNFDTAPQALCTLFVLGTFEGWPE